MTAQEMIDQAREEAMQRYPDHTLMAAATQINLLRDIIRHLCDPENVPYPMTSPEL